MLRALTTNQHGPYGSSTVDEASHTDSGDLPDASRNISALSNGLDFVQYGWHRKLARDRVLAKAGR